MESTMTLHASAGNSHALPFNDILQLIDNIPTQSSQYLDKQQLKSSELFTLPQQLGLLDYLAKHMVTWQNRYPAMILKPEIAVFVSRQLVELNNLDDNQSDKTDILVDNLHKGKAMINQVCNLNGYGLKIYDLNSTLPTDDISIEAAMSELETAQVIAISMEAVNSSDLLVLSDLGNHQHISATTLSKALFFNDYQTDKMSDVMLKSLKLHGINHEPLELLRRYGSREIAAMVGCIIAARYQNVPIILDGLSSIVAAAVIYKIRPDGISHCLIGHDYFHETHEFLRKQVGLLSLISLGISVDTGIGAALSINLIKSALQIYNYTEAKI
jgi:nicotinate-nucleotide--dimethylbenzimidazole phosphoribosyltransferase